jgi:hypothetical protein
MSSAEYLIRRLVDGVAGWLVYQQAAKKTYNEYNLYPPIRDIAIARDWKVEDQQKLIRMAGAAGAPKSVDFVFFREGGRNKGRVIILEVKYLRAANVSGDRAALLKDLHKLSSTSLENLQGFDDEDEFEEPERFILVAAQDLAFRKLANATHSKHSPVARLLRKALRRARPNSVFETTTETHLVEKVHWIVAAFGQPAWQRLIDQGLRKTPPG